MRQPPRLRSPRSPAVPSAARCRDAPLPFALLRPGLSAPPGLLRSDPVSHLLLHHETGVHRWERSPPSRALRRAQRESGSSCSGGCRSRRLHCGRFLHGTSQTRFWTAALGFSHSASPPGHIASAESFTSLPSGTWFSRMDNQTQVKLGRDGRHTRCDTTFSRRRRGVRRPPEDEAILLLAAESGPIAIQRLVTGGDRFSYEKPAVDVWSAGGSSSIRTRQGR